MGQTSDRDVARLAMLRPVLVGRARDEGGVRPGLDELAARLPAEWLTRASTGYDGVVRLGPPAAVARATAPELTVPDVAAPEGTVPGETVAPVVPHPARLRAALVSAGVPDSLAERCAVLLPVMGRVAVGRTDGFMRSRQALSVVEGAAAITPLLEACRMLAARDLAVEAGQVILAGRGLESGEEMSRTARESWEATCRALSAQEVSALTGLGRWHTRETTAIGLAPAPVAEAVLTGLRTGVARWSLVTAFWRRCWNERKLSHEASAEIAGVLFGDDLDTVVVERIAADGTLSMAPWVDKEFHQALEREATRREGQDPRCVAADRAARHEGRTAYGIVDDDGTGQVVITGDAASTAACVDRLHLLARRARAAGDQRSEAQLRSDTARALLLHGVLPLPELGDEPGLVTPDQIEELAAVIAGAPSYELQVVVPWDALTGSAAIVNPCHPGSPHPDPAHPGLSGPAPPGDAPAGDGVGRLLGRFTRFLTRTEILAIAGGPAVTLSRLLVDPADGRCLERSIHGYRPDAAMRAQVRAADVVSRLPGSTLPVRDGDLDHVVPYLLGGATTETNLQGVDRIGHGLKTKGHWEAEMDATRNVTWTTFFARLHRTRPHDYRQYLSTRSAAPGARTGRTVSPGVGGALPWQQQARPECERAEPERPERAGPNERGRGRLEERHLASLLTYAALAGRRARSGLEKPGDDPTTDRELVDDSCRALWTRHTRSDGRRVAGPRPGTPTPEQILATDPQQVLEAAHWTEVVGPDGATPGQVLSDEAGAADRFRRDPGDVGQGWADPSGDDPPPF